MLCWRLAVVQYLCRTIPSCEVFMNGKRLANRIVKECEKMGAEDVKLVDVRSRTPFFDFIVIATVDNTVFADALLRQVAKAVQLDEGVPSLTESSPESDWVVCDYSDTLFHVFVGAEVRDRYDLEALWSPPARGGGKAPAEQAEEDADET
jgi:ribosome-associated protein